MLIPTTVALVAWLADMLADTTTLGSASIGLIASNFTPNQSSTISSFTEANFDGYARKSKGTWSSIFTDPNGLQTAEGSLLQFLPSDTVTANTIYGIFMTGSSSTTLLGCEMFNTPVPLTGPTTQLTIIPRVGLTPNASFGFSVVAP